MSDYYARIKRYTERDGSETSNKYQHNISKNEFSSKNISISPKGFNRDTYGRLTSYKNNVNVKVAELRRKAKVDELGYKGISPDRLRVNNRKNNMLINRLDKIIIEKEKKIEKQRMNLSIERDNEIYKECTFKPRINKNYYNNRDSSSRKPKRTINDLEQWHKQKLKNRVDRTLEKINDKPAFKPKINEKTKRIAKEIEKRGISVEDRLLNFGEAYNRNKKDMINKSVEGLFKPNGRLKREIKNLDKSNQKEVPCNSSRENYHAKRHNMRSNHTKSPRKILQKYISKSVEYEKSSPETKVDLAEEFKLETKPSLKNESPEKILLVSSSSHEEDHTNSQNIQMDAKFNNNINCKYDIAKNKLNKKDTKETMNTDFMSNEAEKMKSLGLKFLDTELNCIQNEDFKQYLNQSSAVVSICNNNERLKNDILFATKFFDKNAKSEISKIFMNETYSDPNEKIETMNTYKSPKIICINDQNPIGCEQESQAVQSNLNNTENCSGKDIVESLITKSIETIKQHEEIFSQRLEINDHKHINNYKNPNDEEFQRKQNAFIKSLSNALICNFGKSTELSQNNLNIKTSSIKNLEMDYNNLIAFDNNKKVVNNNINDKKIEQIQKKQVYSDESPENMNINQKTFTNSMATSRDNTQEDTEFINLSKMIGYPNNESIDGYKNWDNEYINLNFNESYDHDVRELSNANHVSFCSNNNRDLTSNYYCNNSSRNSNMQDLVSNRAVNQEAFIPKMDKNDKNVLYVRKSRNKEYADQNLNAITDNFLQVNFQKDNTKKSSRCTIKHKDSTDDLTSNNSSHYRKGSIKFEEKYLRKFSKNESHENSKSSKESLNFGNQKISRQKINNLPIKNKQSVPSFNFTRSIQSTRERSISEDSKSCTDQSKRSGRGYKDTTKDSSKYEDEIPIKNIDVPLNHDFSKTESKDSLIAAMSKIELSFINKIEFNKTNLVTKNKLEDSPKRSPLRVLNQKSQNFICKSIINDMKNSHLHETYNNNIGEEIRKSIQLAKHNENLNNSTAIKKNSHIDKMDNIINYRLASKNNESKAGLRKKLYEINEQIQKNRFIVEPTENQDLDNKKHVIR